MIWTLQKNTEEQQFNKDLQNEMPASNFPVCLATYFNRSRSVMKILSSVWLKLSSPSMKTL